MGKFIISLVILLIATATPLVYRQFATDNTVKSMSSYYSNYKLIDQFLRQSAGHLDRAKDYIPDSEQIKGFVEQVNQQVSTLIAKSKQAATTISTSISDKEPNKRDTSKTTSAEEQVGGSEKKPSFRQVQCSSEDLKGQEVRLWTKDELAQYGGNSGEPDIYLGFLGLVYNVTINSQHYASDAEYNVFAGRDATRAFVTGNFSHDLNDDIRDIDESLYSHIQSWASFYMSNYPILGRIEGRFFDSNGCGTPELARVKKIMDKLEEVSANQQEQQVNLPDCNSEWNSETKQGRVWCSTKSGGVERSWAGLPRIYSDGESQRCVCFNQDDPGLAELSKSTGLYPGCDATASECILKQ